MTSENRFPALVSIACHDLRGPLATVYGFSRTLGRLELEHPAARYVEMIDAAAAQLDELLDQLSLVTRIQSGRYEPALEVVESLELARGAATDLGEDRLLVSGAGAAVRVETAATRRALAQLARCAARHGGHESVSFAVRGAELELTPLSRPAAQVILAEDLREFGPPAAAILIGALGGALEVEGERLLVRLPPA
jgi:signal transduction histidine kinase